MKKGKLLFLLTAILSLVMIFVACDKTTTDDTSDACTETETSTACEEETIAAVENWQENADHEMHSYFDLCGEEAELPFSEISRIEGKIEDVDYEHNLAIIKTQDLDNKNYVIDTYDVYDLLTGEKIRSESVSNSLHGDPNDRVELSVDIDYPVIRVERRTCTIVDKGEDLDSDYDDEKEYSSNISYYIARKNGELLNTTTETFREDSEWYGNGLVRVHLGNKYVWIDKNLEVVRSIDDIVANGYDLHGFNTEYKGYLYSWNEEELLIFNRSGMVSGRYISGKDAIINVFVLNNGNALIQEFTEVSVYESCDFVLSGTRYVMKSYVMNFINGEIAETELDFVVDSLETAYYQNNIKDDYYSIDLAKGIDSYAVIYKVANGSVAVSPSVCVLDNDLNVLYTVKNDTFGVAINYGIYPLNSNLYVAMIISDGVLSIGIFDLDGNLISTVAAEVELTDKYMVSNTAIYDYHMNLVYDFASKGYSLYTVENNNIYLTKNNFVTGKVETYVITSESNAPELFTDGISLKLHDVETGYYITYDVENDVYRLYNTEGTELLVSHEYIDVPTECEDVAIVTSSFNGEPVIYILKKCTAETNS